jgi:hypothetical protein
VFIIESDVASVDSISSGIETYASPSRCGGTAIRLLNARTTAIAYDLAAIRPAFFDFI